jgi:hypothetical protein
MKYSLPLVLLLFSVAAYAQQGIKGNVVWLSGNQMPGPDKPEAKPKGIAREVHIYEATTLEQTENIENIFFKKISTRLVAKIKSKKNGSFCVKLPPGEYSIFVMEPQGLFANIFDGQGRIQCVTVKHKEYTKITILVNYEAAY